MGFYSAFKGLNSCHALSKK